MATYKVPQDVEADDKLLGPFSFRQFIYLIIVAASIGVAWILAQIFVGLIIIPLPFIIFFGALALPLKKDQPMETYLAAIFSFYFLKPRKRIWQPDGIESLVEITAPTQVEPDRVKDITQSEAQARLSYLTDIIDSRGWSVRGVGVPNQGLGGDSDVPDMLDNSQAGAQRFGKLLEQSHHERTQALNQQIHYQPADQTYQPAPEPVVNQPIQQILQHESTMHQPAAEPLPAQPVSDAPRPTTPAERDLSLKPQQRESSQNLTDQGGQIAAANQQSSSILAPSPAIIELANNSEGLTVADVAKQAARIRSAERGLPEDEVSISLH